MVAFLGSQNTTTRKLYVSQSQKMFLNETKRAFLGFLMSAKGIAANTKEVRAIEWSKPNFKSRVCGSHGSAIVCTMQACSLRGSAFYYGNTICIECTGFK